MSQIILDSYYLIGLYQEKFKEINTIKLNSLLYLTEAYYMCVNDEEKLYEEEFSVSTIGVYNKQVLNFFGNNLENILINNAQIKLGKSIDEDRKELLYEIYKRFGQMSAWSLRELVLSKGSPAGDIIADPYVFYFSLTNAFEVKLYKSHTKRWFERNFLEH